MALDASEFDELPDWRQAVRQAMYKATEKEIIDRYGDYYSGGMGAENVKDLISRLDLDEEMERLKADLVRAA